MKKKILIVSTVLLILIVSPIKVVQGMTMEGAEEITTEGVGELDEESLEETTESLTAESDTLSEESSETESSDEPSVSQESQVIDEDNQTFTKGRALLAQDVDGFWLVDSAATLTELLKDNSKLRFRLTQDIDLGTAGYRLKNGVIIDGANHKITYNKGASYNLGFYVDETNATVEIRNTQFGNLDGSGAVGYYGYLTGIDTGINMTFIFDNVDYYSNNGQMIFNRNGSIIMRGENTIIQKGTGAYAQEWAETNYVEIQSGKTTIDHIGNSSTLGFIWSVSTNAANPRANSSQLIVRKNAQLNITTNTSMTYDYLAPSYIVEENAQLRIDRITSGAARPAFFYMALTQKVTFDFQKNSHVIFNLPTPINLYLATGGMTIGEGATVKIDVASGAIFSAEPASTFTLGMVKPERVEFASTAKGTLGLNSSAAGTTKNLSFISPSVQKIETFETKTSSLPSQTILRTASDLKARVATYTNTASSPDPLTTAELTALGNSQKLIFSQKTDVPTAVTVSADQLTATTGTLHASSFNNGSAATEVKWLVFGAEADINDSTKAQQVIHQTEFDLTNTVSASSYSMAIDKLAPNTQYWLRAMVTNQVGQSQLSEVYLFATQPALDRIRAVAGDDQSAIISGRLLGGLYQQVMVEYSQSSQFPKGETSATKAELLGTNNLLFMANLAGLSEDATYFVRLKVIGLSGQEVILVESPVTRFSTSIEIINVEIPVEMAFQTENSDLGTSQAGRLHSKDYQLVNKGNVPAKISLTGVSKQNQAAEDLTLRQDLNGTNGAEELALQLTTSEGSLFITNELATTPLLVGVLGTESDNQENIRLDGKYFNPSGQVIFPRYNLTFKVEINR